MDLQLKGKEAIVTGGTAGIGLAVARVLSEEGAEVAILGRNSQKLSEAVASLPGRARGIEVDLGTAEGAARLIAALPETDILVNNLGIYEPKAFADITDEEWLYLFEVSGMAEQTKGTKGTVNTVLPGPTRSEGIVGFLQNLASTPNATAEQAEQEFFEKYRTSSLLQRLIEDREVANLVAYVASPLSSATNGAALRVEGGLLRSIA